MGICEDTREGWPTQGQESLELKYPKDSHMKQLSKTVISTQNTKQLTESVKFNTKAFLSQNKSPTYINETITDSSGHWPGMSWIVKKRAVLSTMPNNVC